MALLRQHYISNDLQQSILAFLNSVNPQTVQPENLSKTVTFNKGVLNLATIPN